MRKVRCYSMMDPKRTIKANKDNDKKYDVNGENEDTMEESADQDEPNGELEYFTE